MAGEAGGGRLASRCRRGGPDSGLNGGHIAGHETSGAVVALPILPNVRRGNYRSPKMLGWAGHIGKVG